MPANINEIENRLWSAADELRASSEPVRLSCSIHDNSVACFQWLACYTGEAEG